MDEREPRAGRPNRLAGETSPYLLQHAHNPVDWHPWGEEALAKAREQDRPILLSIGYSACHWCHVMERESFENDEIAALMNEHFVSIKVDREERPDLDEIYMAATLAMQGHGGWPMTVFLTPDTLEPIFAGTYFPPDDRHGLPGFPKVLRTLARAWREDRESLRRQASRVTEHLRRQVESAGPPLAVGVDELRAALEDFADAFDPEYGGFGAAPKFPPSSGLPLLLRLHRRFGDERALEMARATLDGMARGGMYDHIGGGFCRYSVDREWLVPHFEKMLYDNALLARAYLEAYQATGAERYRRVATETLDYLLREMRSETGAFYSATDAESEGEEGKFFVWTPGEIHRILDPEDAERFCAYYDIKPGGNWEGVSIPNTPRPLEAVAGELGLGPEELRESLERSRTRVYEARQRRVKPGLDDKILTAWNGLAIGAFAEAYRVLLDERYLEAAERAADFLWSALRREDGGLYRTHRAGRSHLNAVLEDYAYLAEALLELYEAGGRPERLDQSLELLERTIADFLDDESGAFFNTARDHERLLVRYREGSDGATPSPNGTAAFAAARLSFHLDREDLREIAAAAIRAYGGQIERYPRGFAKTLCAVDFLLQRPIELALVGGRGSAELRAFQAELAKHYLPNRIQAIHDPQADEPGRDRPLVHGKAAVDGTAALYICREFTCRAPITDPAAVDGGLAEARGAEMAESAVVARLKGTATPEGTARRAARFR